jgi:hypothetical protein
MRQMVDVAVPVPMKEYGIFEPTRSRPLPAGWIVPRAHAESPSMAAALDRLRWHGIRIETVKADAHMDVERFVVEGVTRAPRVFQGHQETRLTGRIERATLSVQAGAMLVPGNQSLARLAFYLLEADSDDGLVTWTLIEDGLAPGQGFPVYRVR